MFITRHMYYLESFLIDCKKRHRVLAMPAARAFRSYACRHCARGPVSAAIPIADKLIFYEFGVFHKIIP